MSIIILNKQTKKPSFIIAFWSINYHNPNFKATGAQIDAWIGAETGTKKQGIKPCLIGR
jgi:hypothetical protein